MIKITLEHVRRAVALAPFDSQTAHLAMSPENRRLRLPQTQTLPKEAGVLALLVEDGEQQLNIVLTQRNAQLRGHSGQMSFPGGKRDAGDANFTETALRETREELGVSERIEIIGQLTRIYIPPSNFHVYPSVGYLPFVPAVTPNPSEVAEVFFVPVWMLLDPEYKREEQSDFQGAKISVPYYWLCGQKVWGATALMLSELEHRLRAVL